MRPIIVVENPAKWQLAVEGIEVVASRDYITDAPRFAKQRLRVFNLCRSYRYQSSGYYVSLLAEARGQRPEPSVTTIQDFKAHEIVRILSDDLEDTIQRSLQDIKADSFELSVYFGRNVARRHDALAASVHSLFDAPLMRAFFRRIEERWVITSIKAIGAADIPDTHHETVLDAMRSYFEGRRRRKKKQKRMRYELAILVDADEAEPPSDDKTIAKMVRAAHDAGLEVTLIRREDYRRLAEFDALFIRVTTNVDHYTYRFARRAAALGLVVIDDPESILRCTNKVFLAELLTRHNISAPRTMVLHQGNVDEAAEVLGLPLVLKEPDSAFSQGVHKVSTLEDLRAFAAKMLDDSELIIAQAFSPTDFDWRVGVFGNKPRWVCRYFMAPHHWQIAKTDRSGGRRYGRTEAVPLGEAPKKVIRTALAATKLIGDGLYGVDLKQVGREVVVIEVNDNPTIGIGCEDGATGDVLYDDLIAEFVSRLERRRAEAS